MPIVTLKPTELNPAITAGGFDPNNLAPTEAAILARLNALPPGPNMGAASVTGIIRHDSPVIQFHILPETLDANTIKAWIR
jgi:hypothetical protein